MRKYHSLVSALPRERPQSVGVRALMRAPAELITGIDNSLENAASQSLTEHSSWPQEPTTSQGRYHQSVAQPAGCDEFLQVPANTSTSCDYSY